MEEFLKMLFLLRKDEVRYKKLLHVLKERKGVHVI